ncbi:Nramp family divalent metal transporter [Flavobacteriaceae bacterium]|nr:Nramp family divalent metal transporter [Flavobacteriaceae bacterium]MDB2427427.1 Nramp family divalent metal transporter [Flavobacteriaceae bacterium]MDB4256739.1 Nramp family divalent metal transporter [Flavobacteriaceae bacterium]MDC0332005.1 Nramp family divalent metal transporter [Flavobacteriaceae bacterium]
MKKLMLKSLGPGLLFAGAAVGVSHLVQSTRAGADFGFGLLWALLIAALFKYPFFQFGPRYAAATGETLLDGYKKLGKGILVVSYSISFVTMFIIQAAVTIVTAGLAVNLFGLFDMATWSILITILSISLLLIGKYKLLDSLMKYVILVLTICTLIAVSVALMKNNQSFTFTQVFPKGTIEITFLIAFLGWMPAPLDVSIWQSIWSLEKDKATLKTTTTKQAIFDFNVGYVGTIFLAVCFVILGALVMYNSGESFSTKGDVFASQLIALYTQNLGKFTYIFISIAAFTTMFSTTITTLDASPRTMSKANDLLFSEKIKLGYWFWIILLGIGTFIILRYFRDNMGLMVKIATILSFLTAPFYAILNFILISGKHTPKKHQPSLYLKILSVCGIIFLIVFSAWFLLNF